MNNTLILCDLDGTLIDSDKLNSYSYISAMEQLGFDVPLELKDNKRITEKEIRNCMSSLSEEDVLYIKKLKLNIFLENINMLRLNLKLLDEITKSGATICICTSSKIERAVSECKFFDINYDAIISSKKTKAELERIVNELAEKFGNFERIICYDDDEDVLNVATDCEFETILVKFGI
ncbi:MAG: HAD hydrolase-like protein [Ruminococcus sp.]|nr:HAD hydrolase-like protein [Ruminococcus sp.]